jgi:uncharacterized protein YbjT (DUF2867 family)
MKIVIIGGSGFIGSKLVAELRRHGHSVIAASQTSGLRTVEEEELAEILKTAEVVVDVANAPLAEDKAMMEFFQTSGRNLLAAETIAGVKHHITLSVVGIEHMQGSGYFRAKMAQESLVKGSEIPYTILQTTQLFESVRGIAQSATTDEQIRISNASVQPVASEEVAAVIIALSVGAPLNITVQLAGPERMKLDELIRVFLRETNDPRKLITDKHALYFGVEIDDQSLIPEENARLGKIRFIDWLRKQDK